MKYIATIGVFDGIHIGHQKLLKKMVQIARKKTLKSLVITFKNHPDNVLNPYKISEILTTLRQKVQFIKKLGVDKVISLPFTKSFSFTEPVDFVKRLKKLGVKTIIATGKFRFGKERRGSLKTFEENQIDIIRISNVKIKGIPVSSSSIRTFIKTGNIEKTNFLLGRKYVVIGKVIKGEKRGSITGYPTANISTTQLLPKTGVYAVTVKIKKTHFKGMCNIGYRPTFGNGGRRKLSFEVHILNWKGNIYNKSIEIKFIKRIRNEKKFPSVEDFVSQLKADFKIISKV